MKYFTQNPKPNFILLLKMLTFTVFFLSYFYAIAQVNIETHHGINTAGNDEAITDFVTCASIDPNNYTYAGVEAYLDRATTPTSLSIRGVRIKNDGTMLTSSFDQIRNSLPTHNIIPLKIIPITIGGTLQYLITGYVSHLSTPGLPIPFVIKADASLAATDFKIFYDHYGFFTDVDQLPSEDLLFSGAQTNSLKITAPTRVGWLMRTDPTNFTAQWMRYIHLNQSINSHNYQIVHDAIVLDDDSAFICGTANETVCSPADSFQARAFLAKIDLTNGAFVWHRAIFKKSIGTRLALNNGATKIVMVTNEENLNRFCTLNFFDRGGNFIKRRYFEGPDLNTNFKLNGINYYTHISLHIPTIYQNIYFNSNDEDVFVSGKYIKLNVADKNNGGASLGNFDMPFSIIYYENSSQFGNINFYKSAEQLLNAPQNFLSYTFWGSGNCPSFEFYPPFYVASNTLPCLSNCGTDE